MIFSSNFSSRKKLRWYNKREVNDRKRPVRRMRKEETRQKPILMITSEKRKNKILREITKSKKIVPLKLMSKEELTENLLGTVKREAMPYLLEKENKKVSILEEKLAVFPYLQKDSYQSEKLTRLWERKKDLEARGWIEKKPLFETFLKERKIIVDSDTLDPFYEKILSSKEVEWLKEAPAEKKDLEAIVFSDIEEEIGYVGGKIIDRLKEGTPIQKIKILNLSNEYKYPLHRLFTLLHLPVETEEEPYLSETRIGKRTLSLIQEKESFVEVIDTLKEEFAENRQIESVIQVLNHYAWFEGKIKTIRKLIAYDLERTKVKLSHQKNRIELIRFEEVQEGDVCFLLGFNKENFPTIYKDEAFLTDKEKQELGLWTSEEKNRIEKEKLKRFLYQTPNLTITLKKKSAFDEWNPSLLIEELGIRLVEKESSYQSSDDYNEVLLARYLDKLNKYGIIENDLSLLYHSYEIPYMTFDNQFKGISPDLLKDFLNHKLLLSYSSIENFYRCQFRYYLSNILKIDRYQETFATRIGTIFHAVLEKCLTKEFDFEKTYEEEIQKYEFKPSELVLLSKLKEELQFDVSILKKQKNWTSLQDELHEKKFYLPLGKSDGLETTFMGIVDKILYKEEDGKTYLAVIDYKTGTLPDHLNNIPYGIGMQLPIYLYLIDESNQFENPTVIGIFLQKIVNKELPRQKDKEYWSEKEKKLRLVGYAIEEEDLLEKLDETYQDSKMIQSLKKGKNGFYQYARVLSKEKMKKLEEIVKKNITEADKKIRKGDFSINPKRIGRDLVGCEFCKYKDICFRKEENIPSYKKYTKLSFLGGEEDA